MKDSNEIVATVTNEVFEFAFWMLGSGLYI